MSRIDQSGTRKPALGESHALPVCNYLKHSNSVVPRFFDPRAFFGVQKTLANIVKYRPGGGGANTIIIVSGDYVHAEARRAFFCITSYSAGCLTGIF